MMRHKGELSSGNQFLFRPKYQYNTALPRALECAELPYRLGFDNRNEFFDESMCLGKRIVARYRRNAQNVWLAPVANHSLLFERFTNGTAFSVKTQRKLGPALQWILGRDDREAALRVLFQQKFEIGR